MKPTKLLIKNIGKLAGETVVEINKPLILFYGEIRQGKTTILNSIRWVCGGEFPDDIITHGAAEGSIELHFDNAMIGRSFYRSKTGKETKARPVTFIRNGKPVAQPVNEIKKLLNPFLLDQDFLRNKTELERRRYFVELFDVDTGEIDTKISTQAAEATKLRAKIDGYGDIPLVPVERVDIEALDAEATKIRQHNKTLEDAYEKDCETYNARLNFRSQKELDIRSIDEQIKQAEALIANLRGERGSLVGMLAENPMLPEPKEPTYTPTEAIELKLREAGATNVRAEQFDANKKRAKQRDDDRERLGELEKSNRELKEQKTAKLKAIGDSCGIPGLRFDDDGNFVFEDTTAGMISDSQIMRLSSALSDLYPDGFGLDLIDRAESLGKSIFGFIDRAKAENKTILATIVGEKPADIPEDIGVFVVDGGKVKQSELL